MIFIDPEMQAYSLFESKIAQICRFNWRFMEYEDRLSEAAYIFIIALRIFPTNSGFFWQEYQGILIAHMQNLKAEYRRQTCWISLDKRLRNRNNDVYNHTLLDLLVAQEPDSGDLHVHRFLNTLPFLHQDILNLLMDNKSRRSVCRRLNMSTADLQECLQEIGEDYRDYSLFCQ